MISSWPCRMLRTRPSGSRTRTRAKLCKSTHFSALAYLAFPVTMFSSLWFTLLATQACGAIVKVRPAKPEGATTCPAGSQGKLHVIEHTLQFTLSCLLSKSLLLPTAFNQTSRRTANAQASQRFDLCQRPLHELAVSVSCVLEACMLHKAAMTFSFCTRTCSLGQACCRYLI